MNRTGLVILTALVTAVATSLVWAAGLFLIYRDYASDSPPFALKVEAPHEVALGEPLSIRVRVTNPSDKALKLDSIDVGEKLLEGFSVTGITPDPSGRDSLPGFASYAYSKTLAPGEAWEFRIDLTARREGVWSGDLDFCTPSQNFVTSSVTIRVGGR